MKKILFLLFAVALLGQGCKQKDEYVLGEPYSKLEGINGGWRLSKVEQVGIKAGSEQYRYDVSTYFIGATPAELTFDSNAKTFVFNTNTSKDYFHVAAGPWLFDDDLYPSWVTLGDVAPVELKLLAAVRTFDRQLKMQYLRPACDNDWAIAYNFTFERI